MGSAVRLFLVFGVLLAFSRVGRANDDEHAGGVEFPLECALFLDRMGSLGREPSAAERAQVSRSRSAGPALESAAESVTTQGLPGGGAPSPWGTQWMANIFRAAAPIPQRDVTPNAAKANQSEEDKARVAQEKIDAALDAFEELYVAVYGKDYVAGRPSRSMEKWGHFLANLYVKSPKRKIPEKILRGIQLRKKERLKEIDGKLVELQKLHDSLGPTAETLTPATVSAIKIFAKIGNARVKMVGGGPRDALMEVASDVTDNFEYLMQVDGEELIFDQKLRELTVVVAELVKDGLLDPTNPSVNAAIDDLLVSNFCFVDPSVRAKTFRTLLSYAQVGWRPFKTNWPAERKEALEAAVLALQTTQSDLEKNIRVYSEGFGKARIAFGTISTMTMPDAFEGIPLGHPLQDLVPDMENHPNLVEAGVRAYGNVQNPGDPYQYLDLRVGGLINSARSAAEIYDASGVDGVGRMVMSRFVNDLRMRRLAGRGAKYRLQQAIDLLTEERKSRRWNTVAPILSTISGGLFGRVVRSDGMKNLIPGNLADYLVKQIETGGRQGVLDMKNTATNPNVVVTNENGPPVGAAPPPAPTFRTRKIRALPPTMKNYLPTGEPALTWPWESRKNPPAAEVENGQPRQPHKDDRFFVFLDPDKQYQPPIPATAAPAEATPQANHLRALLRKLDQRAWVLYHYGDRIIRTAAGQSGHVNHQDVARYANDVNELLDAFQNEVMAPFTQCFVDTAEYSYEDAEETMAFYLLQNARYLKGFIMAGPPGAMPGFYARTRPVMAGLAWRVGMLSVRLAYGDGLSDEPIYSRNQVQDPKVRIITARRAVALALVGAGSWALYATGGFGYWDDVMKFFRDPPSAVAPADPGKKDPTQPDPKPGSSQNDSQEQETNN